MANEREDGVRISQTRGVFMISVAAELAVMHPQTLRMYEARGLITPKRSPKNTRLYSRADVEQLRKIQQLTAEGLNLAGVETVLKLEERVQRMRREIARLREEAAAMEQQLTQEVDRVRRAMRTELVPYKGSSDLVPTRQSNPIRIEIRRPRRR